MSQETPGDSLPAREDGDRLITNQQSPEAAACWLAAVIDSAEDAVAASLARRGV